VAAWVGFSSYTTPPAYAQQEISAPEFSRAIKFDISPPLRSMTPIIQTTCTKADDDVDDENGASEAIYRSVKDSLAQDKV